MRFRDLRWVVLQYPGGIKSVPVLQYWHDSFHWQKVPTEVIQVDDKGNVIEEVEDDQDTESIDGETDVASTSEGCDEEGQGSP